MVNGCNYESCWMMLQVIEVYNYESGISGTELTLPDVFLMPSFFH